MSNLVQSFCPLPPAAVRFAQTCPWPNQWIKPIGTTENGPTMPLTQEARKIAQMVYEKIESLFPLSGPTYWGCIGVLLGVVGTLGLQCLFSRQRSSPVALARQLGGALGGDGKGGPGLTVQKVLISVESLAPLVEVSLLEPLQAGFQALTKEFEKFFQDLQNGIEMERFDLFTQRITFLQEHISDIELFLHQLRSDTQTMQERAINNIRTVQPLFHFNGEGPMVGGRRLVQDLPANVRDLLQAGGFDSIREVSWRNGNSAYTAFITLLLTLVSRGTIRITSSWINQHLGAHNYLQPLISFITNTLTTLQAHPEELERILTDPNTTGPMIGWLRQLTGMAIREQVRIEGQEGLQRFRNRMVREFSAYEEEIQQASLEEIINGYIIPMGIGATEPTIKILSNALRLPIGIFSLSERDYTVRTTISGQRPLGYIIRNINHYFFGEHAEQHLQKK